MPRLSTKIISSGSGGLSESQVKTIARAVDAYGGDAFNFREDWLFGGAIYATLSGDRLPIGNDYSSQLTGTARLIPMGGTGRMGVISMHTGETADGQCRVHTCVQGAFDSTKYSQISFEWVGAFVDQATVAEDFRAEIGLVGNAWAIAGVRGFGHFFRYERGVGGHKWMAVNRDLDVETAVILDGTTQGGIATVDGGTITALSLPSSGFFRLKVIGYANATTGAGERAEYYVNDVLCATITTNMVTHSLAGSVEILKTAGTTTRVLVNDYTDLGYVMRSGQVREP